MALVKFGGGVAGISGKVAGTVYARNRAGAYMRNWAKPVSAPSPSQSLNRVRFGNQSNAWSELTADNKKSWNLAAAELTRLNRMGDTYIPTGRQVFLETANNLAIAGLDPISLPPMSFAPPTIAESFTMQFQATSLGVISLVNITSGGVDATKMLQVEATAPYSLANKNNFQNKFRVVGTYEYSATVTTMTADYIAVFGDGAMVDQGVAFRLTAIAVDSGIASPQLIQEKAITESI